MNKFGDFGFIEAIVKADKHKPLFAWAKNKKKEDKLIPNKDLFSFFKEVSEEEFKSVLYVPFITKGLDMILKENHGESIIELNERGVLVIPYYITREIGDKGQLVYHSEWNTLMDEIIKLFVKHEVEVNCLFNTNIKGVKSNNTGIFNYAITETDLYPFE
jgi:hypothetical protein